MVRKQVRQQVADQEAELRGTAPATVGATVADLLRLWLEAKQFDWQPTSARDRAPSRIAEDDELGAIVPRHALAERGKLPPLPLVREEPGLGALVQMKV